MILTTTVVEKNLTNEKVDGFCNNTICSFTMLSVAKKKLVKK